MRDKAPRLQATSPGAQAPRRPGPGAQVRKRPGAQAPRRSGRPGVQMRPGASGAQSPPLETLPLTSYQVGCKKQEVRSPGNLPRRMGASAPRRPGDKAPRLQATSPDAQAPRRLGQAPGRPGSQAQAPRCASALAPRRPGAQGTQAPRRPDASRRLGALAPRRPGAQAPPGNLTSYILPGGL